MTHRFLVLALSITASFHGIACELCDALNTGNFNKVDRLVAKQIKKHRKPDMSLGYPTYLTSFDAVEGWLKKMECVVDTELDACEIKIAIWPGWMILGVLFKADNGDITERCYRIEMGKTIMRKNIDELWLSEAQNCPGFIQEQRKKCDEMEEQLNPKQ